MSWGWGIFPNWDHWDHVTAALAAGTDENLVTNRTVQKSPPSPRGATSRSGCCMVPLCQKILSRWMTSPS